MFVYQGREVILNQDQGLCLNMRGLIKRSFTWNDHWATLCIGRVFSMGKVAHGDLGANNIDQPHIMLRIMLAIPGPIQLSPVATS